MGTSNYQHDRPFPEALANAILPTFVPLSDEDLLHGGTQNQNEVINALIWQRATKKTHPGVGSCCKVLNHNSIHSTRPHAVLVVSMAVLTD